MSQMCHERTWTCYSITPCVRLVPENEFGISEQESKPNRRHDNQADRRDEIPKAILGHRQRYRDRTTPQLNSLVKLMSTLRVNSGTAGRHTSYSRFNRSV